MTKIEVNEQSVLKWPDGVERTRIKERQAQKAWRKGWADTRKALVDELQRLGATSILITRHEDERMDSGVAVWFSRRKEDFSWQQGLGLDTPAPTLDQIDANYRERAKKCHPDNGGDPALFKQMTEWRDAARAWVKGTHNHAHEFVMAIDQYSEARLNLKALQLAFYHIRRLEAVGAPAILNQTLGAFRTKLVASVGGAA
jgi:hypothetical protein